MADLGSWWVVLNSVKAWLCLAEMAAVLWLWSWLRASTGRAPEELESGRALWRHRRCCREKLRQLN